MVLDPSRFAFCSEFYILEKSIEVVVQIKGEPLQLRIEALLKPRSGEYLTRAYLWQDVTIQPTYPKANGKFSRPPQDMRLWVDYDLPWTSRDTADGALAQALGFLKEQCDPEVTA